MLIRKHNIQISIIIKVSDRVPVCRSSSKFCFCRIRPGTRAPINIRIYLKV
ncbi:hypothetical protein OMAG_001980 [Candidatus Omnitrophus magneticus]|uniref:Uncharacterized protein n=1 Tax=Candidatus Omnitrophus magneticus TaxID=1609969 RepID=A0A0F0CRM0_9BACT|nr:hypothetical protein OMAG_001980 [Candidatus Omnitrophus magneticus]